MQGMEGLLLHCLDIYSYGSQMQPPDYVNVKTIPAKLVAK